MAAHGGLSDQEESSTNENASNPGSVGQIAFLTFVSLDFSSTREAKTMVRAWDPLRFGSGSVRTFRHFVGVGVWFSSHPANRKQAWTRTSSLAQSQAIKKRYRLRSSNGFSVSFLRLSRESSTLKVQYNFVPPLRHINLIAHSESLNKRIISIANFIHSS